MENQNVQMIANNGNVTISNANSNLDGTGTLGLLLTAGSSSGAGGTLIRTIVIKATGNTSLGMIRLFVNNGSGPLLFREVMVPANDQTGVVPTFSYTVNDSLRLQPGSRLYASTQNSETFNVIANGNDIINCSC